MKKPTNKPNPRIRKFRQLRKQVSRFAKAQGFHKDEDILQIKS